ncbi:RnfABCDGE type electron transport complex subunit D [Beggiatoa leptomitoformis]|uniref:Ion-translocating oxidoreductase complex subunit D n=1 Tax=Beggiatoa leptomitoformis TaxID=288004 RepID=A0A2N9YB44_9GAMM|nr:RnfABCDGE type electron transport complex subunit D [Beggiatoa leptomitoformis]ALG66977.1 RnfABCDGE type electron transport complex subunit D [Beggiatoa leptomitoformis]AUI67652.1 RnfABCDGE type electron transport complex subunit D [Beggiatoa leptomitoformis]
MNPEIIVSGPHTHAPTTVAIVMRQVIYALIPATVFGIILFGWSALLLLLVSLAAALATEAACLYLMGKPIKPFLNDGSAVLTGWLIALTLPPWAPWWIAVVGVVFALGIGKHLFGGLGQNIFNPAMLARVMLLIAFPVEMTTWIHPTPLFSENAPGLLSSLGITFGGSIPNIDGFSGATPLGHVKTELTLHQTVPHVLQDYNPLYSFLGWTSGSLGETSALLILLGGLYLIYKRVITWHIPVSMLLTSLVLATLFSFINPDRYTDGLYHVLNGGAMLAAFFIATDYVTSPSSKMGQILFGVGIGVIEYTIRTWGGFPEGVGFAVLLMNALAPLIDHYVRPRIYGRTYRGKPIDVSSRS